MASPKVDNILRGSNNCIVGIDDQNRVFGGYDETWPEADAVQDAEEIAIFQREPLTVREQMELADAMIERWKRYKRTAQQNGAYRSAQSQT